MVLVSARSGLLLSLFLWPCSPVLFLLVFVFVFVCMLPASAELASVHFVCRASRMFEQLTRLVAERQTAVVELTSIEVSDNVVSSVCLPLPSTRLTRFVAFCCPACFHGQTRSDPERQVLAIAAPAPGRTVTITSSSTTPLTAVTAVTGASASATPKTTCLSATSAASAASAPSAPAGPAAQAATSGFAASDDDTRSVGPAETSVAISFDAGPGAGQAHVQGPSIAAPASNGTTPTVPGPSEAPVPLTRQPSHAWS